MLQRSCLETEIISPEPVNTLGLNIVIRDIQPLLDSLLFIGSHGIKKSYQDKAKKIFLKMS
jgi:hypothetical protein